MVISQLQAVLSFYVSIFSKGQNGAESHHLIALGHLRPPNRVQAARRADHSLKQIMHVDLGTTRPDSLEIKASCAEHCQIGTRCRFLSEVSQILAHNVSTTPNRHIWHSRAKSVPVSASSTESRSPSRHPDLCPLHFAHGAIAPLGNAPLLHDELRY